MKKQNLTFHVLYYKGYQEYGMFILQQIFKNLLGWNFQEQYDATFNTVNISHNDQTTTQSPKEIFINDNFIDANKFEERRNFADKLRIVNNVPKSPLKLMESVFMI